MRFLKEDPWDRLAQLREKIPNILFQMLLRGSNAVGYTSYPDNVVRAFVKEAADAGIDLFRVFDALNWVPNMEVALEAVREAGALCEAAICYTGDILDPARPKYDLAYYVDLAKELEKRGANLIAIKDMAGLCKPFAAERLIKALREEVGVPIHFHTHDIGGAQAASVLKGAEVGLDIADGAVASMSGLTSQPSLNAIVESLRFTPRETGVDPDGPDRAEPLLGGGPRRSTPRSRSGLQAPSAEVYAYEMPGGQYTNLFQQAKALGPGLALARGLQGVRRGQPALRRHRQGHADLEGRRRHGPVPGRQQPDARRHARPRARAGLPRERRRALRGPARPAARRLPAGAPGARPQGPARDAPTGPARTCRRPTSPRPARRPSALLGRPADRPRRPELPALSRASSPTSPPTSGRTPTRRSCRPRSSSSAPTRPPRTSSRSSRARP